MKCGNISHLAQNTNMKTIKLKLYSIKELSEEAREKAREEYNSHNDYTFLGNDLEYKLVELLKENKIKSDNVQVKYSLSYSQGDGVMFYGELTWKKYTIFITHSGPYSHSNSKFIEIHETKNLGIDIGDDYESKVYKDFENIYQKICKELETYGYDCIETEDSMENFIDICESNDYTFEANGVMRNA